MSFVPIVLVVVLAAMCSKASLRLEPWDPPDQVDLPDEKTVELRSDKRLTGKNCWISMENGYLSASEGEWPLVVDTIAGQVKLSKERALEVKLYGGVDVRGAHCRGLLVGSQLCSHVEHPNPFSENCNVHSDPNFKTVLIISILLLCFSIILLRFTCVRVKHSPPGTSPVSSTKGLFRYTLTFKTPSGETSKCDLTPVKVLMLMLFMSPKVTVYGVAQISNIELTRGLSYDLGDCLLHVEKAQHESILIKEYETSSWLSEVKTEWWCLAYKCDWGIDCSDSPDSGVFESNTLTNWTITQHFCQWGTYGCFMKMGCQKWDFRMKVDKLNIHTVYTPASLHEVISIKASCREGMEFISPLLKDKLSLAHYTIVSGPKDNYICRMPTNKYKPSPGALGDLQLGSGGTYSVPYNLVSCNVHIELGIKCSDVKPFIYNLGTACQTLPSDVEGFLVELDGGKLIISKENNLKMSIQSESIINMTRNAGCKILSEEVLGKLSGGTGLTMRLRTSVTSTMEILEYSSVCLQEKYQLDCRKESHTVAVSQWEAECLIIHGFMNSTLGEEAISYLNMSLSRMIHPESGWSDLIGLLKHPSPLGILSSSATTTGVVVLFCVLMLLKR